MAPYKTFLLVSLTSLSFHVKKKSCLALRNLKLHLLLWPYVVKLLFTTSMKETFNWSSIASTLLICLTYKIFSLWHEEDVIPLSHPISQYKGLIFTSLTLKLTFEENGRVSQKSWICWRLSLVSETLIMCFGYFLTAIYVRLQ